MKGYSERYSIELRFMSHADGILFKDLKEVCGLGQQQVCNFECNKAVIDLTFTGFALVERWA